jgi:hypothetical protein
LQVKIQLKRFDAGFGRKADRLLAYEKHAEAWAVYTRTRMICDPVYNTQMGAAELAGLMRDYRDSFLLVFAGYNAGRGRVQK